MSYHDQFRSIEFYRQKIDRLVYAYRERGYVNSVHDWQKMVRNIADYPDLRRLAEKADYLYKHLQ